MKSDGLKVMVKKFPIFLTVVSLIAFGFLIFYFWQVEKIEAGTEHNVSGWAWSGNLGWISFNCTNRGTCGSVNYGVHICTGDGDVLCGHLATPRRGRLTGLAWSRGTTADVGGIGWIRFDPAIPYPGAPNYSACLDFPGAGEVCDGQGDWTLSGWARAERAITPEGQTLGGWDGWIKMRGTIQAGGTYGAWIDNTVSPAELRGYAWGGDVGGNPEAVVGWISFNCREGGAGGTNICATSNYQVRAVVNSPPTATSPLEGLSYCNISPGEGLASFSWIYNDADNDNQTHYGLRVWRAGTLVVECPEVSQTLSPPFPRTGSSAVRIVATPTPALCDLPSFVGDISYNASFEWRVRARDSFGHWSEWTATRTFSTAAHAHPWIDFTWLPTSPSVNEVVQFTDGSIVYSTPPTKTSFLWTFPDGSPATSSVQNATTTFTSAGLKNVSLRVRDFSNFECTRSRSVSIALPLPEWREIIPF